MFKKIKAVVCTGLEVMYGKRERGSEKEIKKKEKSIKKKKKKNCNAIAYT